MIHNKNKAKPPNQNNNRNIVEALIKKSKKTLSNKDDSLGRLAANISPSYSEFIYKIINNSSLKIVAGNSSYLSKDGKETEQSGLNKRQKNFLSFELSDSGALPHELGHAVDFWFGKSKAFTSRVILSNGKTLRDTFNEEFWQREQEAYEAITDECKSILDSKIGKGAFDTINDNILNLKRLQNEALYPETERQNRKKLQDKLYANGFVEAYYELCTNDFFDAINRDYMPVLDALSSIHDIGPLGLVYHEIGYYQSDLGRKLVQEFFANLFEAKVTSNQVQLDNSAKYFPKSVEAFEELFNIIFDHIERNRRFTDVKTKKGEAND